MAYRTRGSDPGSIGGRSHGGVDPELRATRRRMTPEGGVLWAKEDDRTDPLHQDHERVAWHCPG